MPASEARIRANQANAQLSTGPRTPEGKERSRANGLKHGLTGAGVVLAQADCSEVDRRTKDLLVELDPKSTIGLGLVGQLATLSVRMERGARQEEEAVASRVRHASEAFDHDRVDQAELLFDTIADDPRGNLRKLRRSPEGVDRLIDAWQELRDNLTRPAGPRWTSTHSEMMAYLTGQRLDQAQGGRGDTLGQAVRGEAVRFTDPEWTSLDSEARRGWAVDRLIEQIDSAIVGLEAHDGTLDHRAIELDRIGAADRALFDPSKEASLARRYESEARRGFFKALKELRQAEAEAAERPAPKPVRTPDPIRASAPLASSCAERSPTPRQAEPVKEVWPEYSIAPRDAAARGLDGRVIAIGRAGIGPR